jgi:hypothetical protein
MWPYGIIKSMNKKTPNEKTPTAVDARNYKLLEQRRKITISLIASSVVFVVASVWYTIDFTLEECRLKNMECVLTGNSFLSIVAMLAFTAMVVLTVALMQNKYEIKTGKIATTQRKAIGYVILALFVQFIVSPQIVRFVIFPLLYQLFGA